MKPVETAAQQIMTLLDMELESGGEKYIFSKTRIIEIGEAELRCDCQFDLTVSFEKYQQDGVATNQATLYFRTDECEKFLSALILHGEPLPSDYRQWQEKEMNVVCMNLEATEPPETFASRLAEAFRFIEQRSAC